MRPDVWPDFKSRFGIPQIFEFYAATEGCVSLFNVGGEPGAIGRIPSYLEHRSPVALVRFDVEQQSPARDAMGFCIPCAPNEAGEAIGPLVKGPSHIASRFEGYADADASEKKVLRNVFKAGDAWFRTGDLMRKDERGFFYFVDRIGDTFRWKGENVATSEVSEAICAFPGVQQANVYGVAIPGADGRVGMATLVCQGQLNLLGLREHLLKRLPRYAWPVFLRIQDQMDLTATFKYTKAELVRLGCDPEIGGGLLYFHHPIREAFVPLDRLLYEQIQNGQIRF
jgi:fatty-acyl-CoA synthase